MEHREVRIRLGQGKRLERKLPETLTEAQYKARVATLQELATMLKAVRDPQAAHLLLGDLAVAPTPEAASKLERHIRRFVSDRAGRGPAAPQPQLITFREFGMQWATGELAKKHPHYLREPSPGHVKSNRARVLRLSKTIGDVPIVRFTHEDAKRALAALPKSISGSTFRHYAQVIQTVLRKAVEPVGLIPASKYPLPWAKFLPLTEAPPAFPILYPKEDAALGGDVSVPPWRRLLYCLAVREGLRASHLFRLRYANIDFDNGTITVGVGKNNADARQWPLNAGVAKALYQFRGGAKPRDHIFPRLDPDEMLELADWLRDDLRRAGLTRADLFADGDGQAPIRFQDLRATFVSLHLAMGWSEVDVMLRTQHTSTTVLHRHYARRLGIAKNIIKRQGPLLPLDQVLKGGGEGGGGKLAK